ncbi:alpha/beta fold hydrolase [Kosakonia sp. BK9b]
MSRLFVLLFTVLMSCTVWGETAFRQLRINEDNPRPLDVALWYPTLERGAPQTIGDNIVFRGTQALREAKPAPGDHPLLLISHGYGGNWRNLNWLAQQMALQGYIVAAVDHPGTTTRNQHPQDAQQLWLRPQDLQHVLDKVIGNPELAGQVDRQRIAATGHSLGGWTVLELAGARFDAQRFMTDCQQHAQLSGCKLTATLGIDQPLAARKLAEDAREPRIKAVVSLDLGLARGFRPESLHQIMVPVLIMAAQADSDALPARLESGYLVEHIPAERQRYRRVAGATHFSFMQMCKPGAVALIEQETPGDGVVCEDGGTLSRSAIHQHLFAEISQFLNQALAYQPPRAGNPLASSR